jgi:hypothetical protein
MWYYSVNNQPVGPVADETIKTLIANRTVTAQTLVWKEGMANWQTMSTTALAAFLPTTAQTPPMMTVPPAAVYAQPAPVYYGQVKPAAQQIKELNDMFTWFWVCLILVIVTFGVSAIASGVLFFIIIYRCWQLIQDGYARTTPGKAVGFCFIPFFNFYWIFEAFPGLAKDTNAFVGRRNLPIQPLEEGLPTAYCILTLCNYIPYLDFVTGIGTFILMIIMLNKFKNTAISVIQCTQH